MSDVIFLGFAEAAAGADPLDLGGLRTVITSSIYPFLLTGWYCVLAVRQGKRLSGKLVIQNKEGLTLYSADLSTVPSGPPIGPHAWSVRAVQIGTPAIGLFVAPVPGAYNVRFVTATDDNGIGAVRFDYVRAPPFDEAFRRAVASAPGALRAVAFVFTHGGKPVLAPYVALDRESPQLDVAGPVVWYEDLPDSADVAGSHVDLRYLRESMHALLLSGESMLASGAGSTRRLYSIELIERCLAAFRSLLDEDPLEERVQKFIEENLVLLAQFGGERILVKPPILTFYRADFGIITPRRELILVEIERPGMRLFTKAGKMSADLQQPFDQVANWFRAFEKDRSAALRCIPNCPTDITRLRACVIAGRDSPSTEEAKAKLLGGGLPERVDFLTYDDLTRAAFRLATHGAMVRSR